MPALDSPTTTGVERAITAIRGDITLPHMATFTDTELADWCLIAQSGQEKWAAGQQSSAVNSLFYELGRSGAARGVPLRELVRALILVLNLCRAADCGQQYLPIETRPLDPVLAFWDFARYYLIRGYEDRTR